VTASFAHRRPKAVRTLIIDLLWGPLVRTLLMVEEVNIKVV